MGKEWSVRYCKVPTLAMIASQVSCRNRSLPEWIPEWIHASSGKSMAARLDAERSGEEIRLHPPVGWGSSPDPLIFERAWRPALRVDSFLLLAQTMGVMVMETLCASSR